MSGADRGDRQGKLEQILAEYLHSVERGAPLDRQVLLSAHPELADDLELFFRNHDSIGRLAEPLKAAVDAPTLVGVADIIPAQAGQTVRYFGDYELLEEIARGGMGVVFKARQVNLNRVVALKMILAGQLANDSDVKRFYAEAEAAANLDHPGIVPIFEIGQHDGQHYFSMAFVEGESLARKVANGPLPPREAAQLVKQVAEAVDYAHAKGIIHRDLKPANVLLDKQGQPKVTDFGLAKQTQGDSGLTGTGQILGTPSYMPPEQAAGRGEQVGPAADVYALGAILYCLVTGRPPFQAANPLDTLLQVLKQEPVPPRQLNAHLPLDLETVALTCLEKSPLRRYASARRVAEELERFLAGRPILARPVGTFERTWRWCRRNRIVASLIGAVALSLVAGIIISSYFAALAANRADEKGKLADRNQALFESERDAKQEAEERRKQSDASAKLARRRLYDARMNLTQNAWEDSRIASVVDLLERSRPSADGEDLRGFEWYYWNRLCHRDLLTFKGHTGPVTSVAFGPDGIRIVSGSADGTVKVWNTETGHEIITLKAETGNVSFVAFSPNGSQIAAGGGWGNSDGRDRSARVWDVSTGEQTLTLEGHKLQVRSISFNPDGTRIATGDDEMVRIWSSSTGQEMLALNGHTGPVMSVAFSPDGKRIAFGEADLAKTWDPAAARHVGKAMVTVCDAATGRETGTLKGHTGDIHGIAFSPDGAKIASAGGFGDNTVKVWDVTTGQELLSLRGPTGSIFGIAFSPDGTRIATASGASAFGMGDNTVRLWDAVTGQEVVTLKGHTGQVLAVAFSPDGTRIASPSGDRTVKIWDAATSPETRTLSGDKLGSVHSVAMSSDGARVAAAGQFLNNAVKIWDAATGQETLTLNGAGNLVALSPDGTRLASIMLDRTGTVKLWDAVAGREIVALKGHTGHVSSVAFSPDGARIATGGGHPPGVAGDGDGTVRIWDAGTGEELRTLRGHAAPGGVTSVAFNADGSSIVSASGPEVILWNAASGEQLAALKHNAGNIDVARFSPDGTSVALACVDGTVGLWDSDLREEIRQLRGHTAPVWSIAFSGDGTRIASASYDGTVKVWDAATGEETMALKGFAMPVSSIAFSQDGTRIATASWDRTVKIWDAPRDSSVDERRARSRAHRAWSIVKSPARTPDAYRFGVKTVEESDQPMQDVPDRLLTLGVAQFRLGDFQAAVETLTNVGRLARADPAGALPAYLAVLAMAHHQLGHRQEAEACLQEFRELMRNPPWSSDQVLRDFALEADWAISSAPFEWMPLVPVEMRSAGGAVLTKLADGSILLSGENPPNDTYSIECLADVPRLTALRLDVLRDDSLPNGGPGRIANGTFVLTAIECGVQRRADGSEITSVSFRRAIPEFVQAGGDVQALIDGTGKGAWAIWRPDAPLSNRSLVLEVNEPIALERGAKFTITLRHQSQRPDGNLGRFRLAASGSLRERVE